MKKLLVGVLGVVILVSGIGIATIKDIQTSESGMLIEFRDNTGYYIGE